MSRHAVPQTESRDADIDVRSTLRQTRLASSKGKRWNGNFDSLPVEFLKGVMEKMADYGENVQFSLVTGGSEPGYQIANNDGKKMAFDRNHHLWRPEGDEFTGANATRNFTVEQVKSAINGIRATSGTTRTTRTASRSSSGTGTGVPRTTAARLDEQFAAQRYEYFKNNRQTLPPTISQHTEEITELMRKGKSAEEAFTEVVQKHY
jgi:hypothetical protein